MRLRDYLEQRGISVLQFSELLGCTQNYLSAICREKVLPSQRLARDIERLTHGEVIIQHSKLSKKQELNKSIEQEIKKYKARLIAERDAKLSKKVEV